MEKNSQQIQPIATQTLERVQSLVADLDIDLDAPLSDFVIFDFTFFELFIFSFLQSLL